MAGVLIKNLARRRQTTSRIVFSDIAASILPEWDISLVFVGPAQACALNKQLRGKDYTPNVLSYIAGNKSAEIIICPAEAAKQAPSFQLPASSFQLLLFIHGLLHIKGWVHGGTMEQCERKLLALYGAARSHRHRHRHVPGKAGRRRGTLR
ncbi:rRNA maturation RNase YbeY [Candidatus Kaiserbacteria bacterium]|nr:rRNA maturation RNase YbeY [Candidatus Kaiserbacteria bacterium]